jgi:hypothetical protein
MNCERRFNVPCKRRVAISSLSRTFGPPLSTLLAVALSVIVYLTVPCVLKADLLVAGRGNGILRFGGTGASLGTFVAPRSGGLVQPINPVYGPDGNLYVPDAQGNTVGRFNGATGNFIDSFVSAGSGGLTWSYAITFGPDGHLYVADTPAGVIRRYNGTTGVYMGVFADFSEWHRGVLESLVFGPDGNLYVADEITVVKVNGATGAFMSIFVTAAGMLAFGSDGTLYVGTAWNGVLRYNGTTGAFISQFVPFNGSRADSSIAFGPDGNLYVPYYNEFAGQLDNVQRFNGQTGAFIGVFVPAGVTGQIDGMVFTPGAGVPTAIQPNHGGNSGLVTVTVTGQGFQNSTTVKLTGLGPDITGTNTTVPYPSALATTFDLTGATPGIRNIVITSPTGTSATLTSGFTVEQGGTPQLWARLTGLNRIQINSPQTFYVTYGNSGNRDALGAHLLIYVPSSVASNLTLGNASGVISTRAQGANTVMMINVGRVPGGSTSFIPITLAAGASQAAFQVRVRISGR